MHLVIRAVGIHLDLFENDAFFLLDVFVAEKRVQHQIAQHIGGDREVLVQNLGVEADHLTTGEGVQIAAD